ncbi:hypothetical protein NX059_003200 [Plenodomus lindquistii]|nr:hypothetical protein NX059_003200 [Plenodomus lindquistii]
MSLSQRPAARFFAAFYRWNVQNSSRQCAIFSPRLLSGEFYTRNSYARSYHATRHLFQQQAEAASNVQSDQSPTELEDTSESLEQKDDRQHGALGAQEPATHDLDPEAEALKTSVRKLMGSVPGSVAVITVASIDPETKEHVPMGIAVSSLNTVSMNPPMISFNIKEPSKTLDAIRNGKGLFRVHIPSANKGGANVVEQFCNGNHADAYSKRRKNLKKLWVPKNPKDDRSTPSMAPQIWEDDVQAAMECTVTQEMTVADHVILVASIDSIDKKDIKCPAVLYFNGNYMRVDGSVIQPHTSATGAQLQSKDDPLSKAQRIWDCKQFPGEQERLRYMEDLKVFLKSDKSNLEMSKNNIRKLGTIVPLYPLALGIDLFLLMSHCRQEMGLPNPQISAARTKLPVMSEFYGRLSPSSLDTIIERAKKLIALDRRFLSLDYNVFLQHLGASVGCINLLPSDIMKPLRAAGLVDPISTPDDGATFNILQLERLEKDLIQRARKLPQAVNEGLHKFWGNDTGARYYFNPAHARILKIAHPKTFNQDRVDITGHVNLPETRVILRRVIYTLYPSVEAEFRRHRALPISEILRRSNVDPTITGVDVDYFFLKIRHIYNTTQRFIDFAPKVYALLDAWLEHKVSWTDLQSRVKQFVHDMPLRATTWNTADQLAAMGLHYKATVLVPGQEEPQNVATGLLLATLVAKELRDFYGKGTREQNVAIATFLKEKYNYEVRVKPELLETPGLEQEDSGGELREAMLANLNVDVRGDAAGDGQSKDGQGDGNVKEVRL